MQQRELGYGSIFRKRISLPVSEGKTKPPQQDGSDCASVGRRPEFTLCLIIAWDFAYGSFPQDHSLSAPVETILVLLLIDGRPVGISYL